MQSTSESIGHTHPPPDALLRTRRWPGLAAIGAALVLYVALPERLTAGPRWLLPALEVALIVGVLVATPRRSEHVHRLTVRRLFAFALLGFVTLANVVSLALLVHLLVAGGPTNGRELIVSASQIWLTNVLIFGLVYWELDRGGPEERARHALDPPEMSGGKAPPSDSCSRRRASEPLAGVPASSTISTSPSPTQRRSARLMPCR